MSTLSDRLRGYAQKHDPIVWSTDIMSPRQKAELEAADELDRLTARVAELEAAASAALKHADSNGMQGWSVFNRLRAAMEKCAFIVLTTLKGATGSAANWARLALPPTHHNPKCSNLLFTIQRYFMFLLTITRFLRRKITQVLVYLMKGRQ